MKINHIEHYIDTVYVKKVSFLLFFGNGYIFLNKQNKSIYLSFLGNIMNEFILIWYFLST